MNYWTPAEDAKLIALYPDHSAGQIAAALHWGVSLKTPNARTVGPDAGLSRQVPHE